MIHEVAISPCPNWVGGSQRGHVAFSDDRRTLPLSTDPIAVSGWTNVQHLMSGHVPD